MKKVQLISTLREKLNPSATKSLRNDGRVPAVLYGSKTKNINLSLPMIDILPLLDTIQPSFIALTLEGKVYDCIIKEVQYHPVSDSPLHIDFLQVDESKQIRLNIPLTFTGKAPGILKGGELSVRKRTLSVRALPKDMPEKLIVDISSLELGEKAVVSKIKKGSYTILDQPQIPVVSVVIPRALRSKEAGEGEEAGTGEEAGAETKE